MFRRYLAVAFLITLTLVLARSARAEIPTGRLPFLPSIVSPIPRFVSAAPRFVTVPPLALQAVTRVDSSFLGRVTKLVNDMKPPVSGDPRDAASRNPTIRDPARERDATSWGIRSAPLSGSGMGMAAGGIGAAGAQLVDLGNVAKKLPVKFGPVIFQGGGGLSVKAPW